LTQRSIDDNICSIEIIVGGKRQKKGDFYQKTMNSGIKSRKITFLWLNNVVI